MGLKIKFIEILSWTSEYNGGEVKDMLALCLLTVKMHCHTMKCCVRHTYNHGMQQYIQNTQNSKTPNIGSYHPGAKMKHIEQVCV